MDAFETNQAKIAELKQKIEELGGVAIVWTPKDIHQKRPDWNLERCQEELGFAAEKLEERSIEKGWETIEENLADSPAS